MSASALLLRLLLCVILILNGSGAAFAATGMELAHRAGAGAHGAVASTHTNMADEASTGEQRPCHGSAPGPDPEPTQPASKHAVSDDRPADGDCCPSSHCACLQHLTATMPQFVIRPAVIAKAASDRAISRAHTAPPILHLIRPPIG